MAPVLQLDKPCPRCQLKFVANTVFPFSCGCLFHPWCLWAELLAGGRACPQCKKEGDSQWMEAWGFDALATPKPQATEDTAANKSSVLVVELDGESNKDADILMIRKRPSSGIFEGEPAQKMAKLDLGPSPVVGKVEHKISTPLSCPTEYIWRFPCFMFRERASDKIEAVAEAVAYLALHSTFL